VRMIARSASPWSTPGFAVSLLLALAARVPYFVLGALIVLVLRARGESFGAPGPAVGICSLGIAARHTQRPRFRSSIPVRTIAGRV
jgi:hypothetical protein